MKKIANFVALVFLFQVLLGCEKKASSVEVLSSEIYEIENTSTIEDKIKKAREYDEYMQERRGEIVAQEKVYQQNFPSYASSEDLDKGQICSRYYEKIDGVSVATPINVTDLVRNERHCTCKFKITTYGGKELEYKAILKRDPYREKFKNRHEKDYYEFDPDAYYLVEMELITPIETKRITNSVNTSLIGDVVSMSEDMQSEKLVELFTKYENENYPYYFKDAPEKSGGTLIVLDYIKVNLTGSKYDEYLVLFAKDKMKCFIVDNGVIIKDYYVPCVDLTPSIVNGKTIITSCFDYIGDYNQNGINEINFISGVYRNRMYFIEFDGESFNVKNIYTNFSMYDLKKIKYNDDVSITIYTVGLCFDSHVYVESIAQLVTSMISDDIEVVLKYNDIYNEWIVDKLRHI